ncbi:unnamed protein product [Camellia sinensis]
MSTVDFLYEMGLSAESVGKILTRCPHIISYSVEDKLRPTTEYFRSLGVDVALLLHRSPQTFGLSIEANLKPVTEFFLERGYNIEDVATMISRYGALCILLACWIYFGYSLDERIKPRYAIVTESGVRLLLNQVLSLSDGEFDKGVEAENEEEYWMT